MSRITPALCVLLFGCSEQGFNKTEGGTRGGAPAVKVTPTALDFGSLSSGDDAMVRTFTIKSVGDEDLHVDSVFISAEDAGFTILTDTTAFVLEPGDSADIDVAFQPVAPTNSSVAVVSSDDPDAPQVTVDLYGEAEGALLLIDPDPMDFGDTYVGCAKDNTIDLTSVGTDTLIISGLSFMGDGFTLNTGYALPITLEPGESFALDFTFEPTDEAEFGGALTVTSNEALGVRTGTQTGTGVFAIEYTDEWVVPEDPPTDIMFIVDQSGSMDDDQRALAENFRNFISALNTYSTDWQIIVANNDQGCNTTGILTPSTSGYQSIFEDAVSEGSGTYIVDYEALLVPAANGIEATDARECNEGFMRPEALLHIVAVSDEPEQSDCTDIWSACESRWEELVDEIRAKKGSDALTKVSAVAGPVPGGCSGAGNSAEPGTGYAEAVAETGGVFLSICDDWGASVEELAEASVQQDTFALSHNAYESSIVVLVNGSPRSSGWHYDDDTNAVIFDSAPPDEGATVTISYGAPVTCD